MLNFSSAKGSGPSLALSYAIAVLGVMAAIIIDLLLETYLQALPTLFIFLCAIILAAWLGGAGPGLAATVLSVLAFDYFFLAPFFSLSLVVKDMPRLALFALAALFVVGLIATLRNTAESLQRSHADLEDKVRDLERLNAALQIEGSERQRAEQKSRKIERELQATIDTIPVLVASFEPDGSLDFVNRPWRDYTGISQEKAKAMTWASSAHPDDLRAGEIEWRACLASGRAFEMDRRLRRADGEYRWHMTRRVPLRNDEGNIVKWYGIAFDIEDQKRAESALRESEARLAEVERELRLTIDRIPTLAWHTRPDGFAEYLNKRWLDYTGLSLDRALGWEWQVAIHPEDLPGLLDSWREILSAGKPAEVEARMRRFDGEYRWFLFRPEPFRDDSGNIVRWYGTNTDIEDRKRAEDALRQSEAYLTEAQRLSHTGSFGWNVSSGEIVWSEESCRIFGHDPLTAITLDMVMDRVHPDDAALVRQVIKHAISHKGAFDFEHRLLMPDGSVKHLNVVAHAITDESSECQFVGAVMDITARKKSEEALRNSEQRYRHLFQHMPIALWQLNASKVVELFKGLRAEGVTELGPYVAQHPEFLAHAMDAVKIEEVNDRMIEMLGAGDASEVLGPLTRFCHIHPDAFLRGLESRFRGELMHQLETKIVTLDGRVLDVLLAATRPGLTNDPDMSLVGLIDITEQVRAREMLQRVQADFAHAARVSMLGELTASIAHEVNQPLAAIATNGEVGLRLLNHSEPDLAEVRELTQCVVDDARRAADVIARVRAIATRQAPEQTLLSVDEVIHEALLFLRHEVQSHGLTVTHHPNPAAPKVLGDRTQLQQVIVNLTVNAIQAMAHAETERRTLVIRTAFSDPRTLCCTLEDSGPGINPKHLDHLFDSFFTTKDAGMGLGLPISRSIIEAHGGCIRADNGSAYGGARFSFTLPAKLH
jgi:PAS domain S-box-containing protein